ncbi:diacylglycerol/polyprenol kinase family protein [Synechococcus sp. PCC 7336]|uniref:diacylglycerol/polyprenol kinase family protein n=1 Tax=Synechococcus sp. PCC 7336 TaxID=195250 RepID=UPI00034A5ED0|nr:hypothetical protein [Synechococcus sp. PCC 7336]
MATVDVGLGGQLACYGIWLGLVFAIAEGLRSRQVDGELVRKVIHIGIGNIIILAWLFDIPRTVAVIVSAAFSLIALLSYRVKILQSLNGVDRQSYGTFFYAASIAILFAVFWHSGWHAYAAIGVLVMTWGDALAALIGRHWGRHRYTVAGMTKSWEGSLAMWLASAVAIAAVAAVHSYWGSGAWMPVWAIALGSSAIAAIATALEVFSWRGLDNITVPLASAALSFWLFRALN